MWLEKCLFGCLILVAVNGMEPTESQCGYKSCHPLKPGFINVHLVPHTHDDVGWLKTVDQYFYGSNSSIQRAGVQYILDSVVQELAKDPNRRFIYVETAFFWKWWIHQHDFVKHQVRRFVNNGQLEFIGGGWTMNDEATTHYQSIIDQFTWGLRKLNESFGECGRPKIGWQIDPFGHSREMASIFAQLGFDGLLLGRIDYEDKEFRFKSKSAEMVWQGSSNLGDKANIFTGVMYNTYGPPPGFCFDIMCNDEPIIDDKKSPLYNIERKVDDFFAYLDNVTNVYTTHNIILTMGEDFHYQNADTWYKNLDRLIYYANQRQVNGSKYNLIYSTPSCYVKAVHDETVNKAWPVKTDDFFPYSSDQHSFWTGYFTSRPTLKRFEREGNNFLQICKQLYALADLGPEDWVDLNALREAMGVMQHHDAVTGTEKQHVANDYARILQAGFDECAFIANTALSQIMLGENLTQSQKNEKNQREEPPAPEIPMVTCLLTNVSSCPFSETHDEFVVTVYNPLSRPVSKYVRLPVMGKAYQVVNPSGNKLEVDIFPTAQSILKIPGRTSGAKVELVFLAANVPPLGFVSYKVTKIDGDRVVKAEAGNYLKFSDVGFKIRTDTGLLEEVTINGKTVSMTQNLFYYDGYVGDNYEAANRSSGAYIFRPISQKPIPVTEKANFQIYTGNIIAEVHQIFNEWASQIIRIYSNETFIEFDWLVGPIPHDEVNGKEIVSLFETGINTKSQFYTDSNGRELIKRVRSFRPTWKLDLHEDVAGNYYPVNTKIVIADANQDLEVAILTDRSQGGTSMRDGDIELMIHRNCLHDDAFGVGEPLNETAFGDGLVARGSHYLVLGSLKTKTGQVSTTAIEKDIAQRKLLSSWIFLSTAPYKTPLLLEFSGLKRALPPNVQILTLEPWKGSSFLLRLEHVFEKGEDTALSQPAIVDLKGLFTTFEIVTIKETTLGANQWVSENNRFVFKIGDNLESLVQNRENISDGSVWKQQYHQNNKRATVIDALDDLKIVLDPMQIRTFILEIKKN